MNEREEKLGMLNCQILDVKSPKTNPRGNTSGRIYGVVYKHVDKEDGKWEGGDWAIVAMNWGTNSSRTHCLGIRWFNEGKGNPISSGYRTWLVIPDILHQAILDKLLINKEIDEEMHTEIVKFLHRDRLPEALRTYLNGRAKQ